MAKKTGIWATMELGSSKEFVTFFKKNLKNHFISLCLILSGLIFIFTGELFPKYEFVLIIFGFIFVLVGGGHLIYSTVVEHISRKRIT